MDVSRETEARLHAYADLLARWTSKINLISPATVPDLWDRHILDSLQILDAAPDNWTTWTDLGSGGGLPGCVVAICASGDQHVTLVESDQRKATFLRTVQRELSLPTTILVERIETINLPPQDVVSARALAPMGKLLSFVAPLLAPHGTALLPKGKSWEAEIAAAQASWAFDCDAIPSKTSEDARILRITGLARRGS